MKSHKGDWRPSLQESNLKLTGENNHFEIIYNVTTLITAIQIKN